MEFHEIDSKGKLWIERVATLPTWTSADVGRLVYAIDVDKFYKGNSSEWAEFGNPVTIYGGSVLTPAFFTYVNGSQIQIRPSRYHHAGSSAEQIVYWNSTLTFTFSLTGTQFYYLYLDDSAIASLGSPLIGASQLIASTTAPTFNDAAGGYYNSYDRCIGAFRAISGSLARFYQVTKERIMWESQVSLYAAHPSSWTTVTGYVPTFSNSADMTFTVDAHGYVGYYVCYARPYGSTGTGHEVGNSRNIYSGDNDAFWTTNALTFPVDSSGRIQVYVNTSSANATVKIFQNGYTLPPGII